jgi:O-antigen ligase
LALLVLAFAALSSLSALALTGVALRWTTLATVLAAASTLGLFRSGTANAFFVALGEGFFVPVVIVPAGDGHADDFFDIAQVFELVFRTERNGTAFGSSTGGAADAMHVGFGLVREIEVDH